MMGSDITGKLVSNTMWKHRLFRSFHLPHPYAFWVILSHHTPSITFIVKWQSYGYMISCQEIFHKISRFVAANFYFFWSVWKVTTFIKFTRVNGQPFTSSSMFKHWDDHLRIVMPAMIWFWMEIIMIVYT